ncbi:unnamed protein product [Sphenostylis stenocarpa]|uniref:Uncharacterized protein n=1 Tax=Sphenostylis stenocarpa TaxID=92480 RepID=A0AA86RKT4_9FABA|nr:unnamed protein product [Sphenostylis stenocarpa]
MAHDQESRLVLHEFKSLIDTNPNDEMLELGQICDGESKGERVALESDLERKEGQLCGIDFEIFIIRAT